jgi:hypothetical protein
MFSNLLSSNNFVQTAAQSRASQPKRAIGCGTQRVLPQIDKSIPPAERPKPHFMGKISQAAPSRSLILADQHSYENFRDHRKSRFRESQTNP